MEVIEAETSFSSLSVNGCGATCGSPPPLVSTNTSASVARALSASSKRLRLETPWASGVSQSTSTRHSTSSINWQTTIVPWNMACSGCSLCRSRKVSVRTATWFD